ncbi:MAG TPA: hypothetical protein VJ689_04155 [Gaiellaceae bacterium]|nr:hypothetical protein [Gaiellaceae bacterium]
MRHAADTVLVETQDTSQSTLAQLRKEERSLSARRSRLHDRIDFLRAGGGGTNAEETARTLADLERQEREVSERRLELHEQIELLSAEAPRAEQA